MERHNPSPPFDEATAVSLDELSMDNQDHVNGDGLETDSQATVEYDSNDERSEEIEIEVGDDISVISIHSTSSELTTEERSHTTNDTNISNIFAFIHRRNARQAVIDTLLMLSVDRPHDLPYIVWHRDTLPDLSEETRNQIVRDELSSRNRYVNASDLRSIRVRGVFGRQYLDFRHMDQAYEFGSWLLLNLCHPDFPNGIYNRN